MNAYVLGVGKTRFGPSSHPMTRLAHEAILGALADADMEITDIGAVLVANFLGGPNESQLHLGSVVMGLFPGLHVPSWRVEAACASGGVAIHQAVTMLGTYDPILVVGVERLSGRPGIEQTRNIGMAGDVLLDSAQGLNFPASYALVAQRHMQRYGTRTRDFELISLKNHENARHNPLAHFHHKVVTQADIDAGATVASPLRLFDCCPVSDGAAAAIISREARDARSVPILGSAVAADVISLAQRDEHTSFAAARFAAGEAYRQADITPADIDLAEVHDCFTIAEIVAMEDLGLAPAGEAVDLIRADETRPGGTMPVNPSGGLKAGGHAIGATGTRTPRSRSSGPWSRCSMSRASLRATRRRCRWTSCRPRSRGRSGSAVCTSSTRRRGCGSWRSSGPPRPRTRPPSSSSTSRSHSARRPSGWLTAPASWSTAC